MATEFNDATDWAVFVRNSKTMTNGNSYANRWSEQTLAALRAAGVLDNMVDGTTPPALDKFWLDKNTDPAVLKEWDAIGSAWEEITFHRLFERAAVTPIAVTGGTGNAIVASQPSIFISNRLYSLTPIADNTGAVTVQVTGVGTFNMTYLDGSALAPGELAAGRPKILLFANGRFQVVFSTADLNAAVDAAEDAAIAALAARDAAIAAANKIPTPAANDSDNGKQITVSGHTYTLSTPPIPFSGIKTYLADVAADQPTTDPNGYYVIFRDTDNIPNSGMTLAKVASQPTHAGRIQNGNGTWYEYKEQIYWAEQFGLKATNTGAQNTTAINAMFTVGVAQAVGEYRIGKGTFLIGTARINMPKRTRLVGSGRSAAAGSDGYTTFVKDFAGDWMIGVDESCILSDFYMRPNTGITGGAYVYIGGRNWVMRVDQRKFDTHSKVSDPADTTQNCNGWRNIDCGFYDMPNRRFEVSQFRRATDWSAASTYTVGTEARDTTDGLNYRCAVAVTSAPGSGTFAAYRSANPTRWTLSSFPFGPPDVNDGKMLGADINQGGTAGTSFAVYIDNAYDNEFDIRIQQDAGYGLVFEHYSRGNHGYAYLEKRSGYSGAVVEDLYFGVTTEGNQIRCGQTSKFPLITDGNTGRNQATFYHSSLSSSGNAVSRLMVRNYAFTQGLNLFENGRIDSYGPASSGTVLQVYQNSVASGAISVSSGTVTYGTTSDERLKIIKGAMDRAKARAAVMLMELWDFDWKDPARGSAQGPMAQALYLIFPNAVIKGHYVDRSGTQATIDDDIVDDLPDADRELVEASMEHVPWMIDLSKLTVPLIAAVQDMSQQLDDLAQWKIEAESRLVALEAACIGA